MICSSIAQLIWNTKEDENYLSFPFFDYLISFEKHGLKFVDENEKETLVGKISIQRFDQEHGFCGTVRGNDILRDSSDSSKSSKVFLDHAIVLVLSSYPGLGTGSEWISLRSEMSDMVFNLERYD